jgi:hypothetical protein
MRPFYPLIACVLLAPVGCGGPGTYPAGGKVVFADGGALPGGVVLCEPAEGEAKVSVRGFIRPDGTFRLGTYKDDDGAPEGKYRVKIQPPANMVADIKKRPPPSIHADFTEFETSRLEITVTRRRADNEFTLTVAKP